MTRRLLLLAVCLCGVVSAQSAVAISDIPIKEATEERFYRDGSGNVEYICTAVATIRPESTWTRSADSSYQPSSTVAQGTLTSIAVLTNVATATTSVAHGYSIGQWVTVTGGSVDTDLNGFYKIASVPSGTTFTFVVANVSDATYNEATLRFSSSAPRTNALVWAIKKFIYTGGDIDRSLPARGNLSMDKACDSRTTYF
jgi:hypothetical protein